MTTEQMIEKYKAEMQKMISSSNQPQPQRTKDEPDVMPLQSETNLQQAPAASIEDFPSFDADREKLTRRIEEILAQNSDVSRNEDLPQNLVAQNTDNLPTEFSSDQGDLIMQANDIVIDTPNPPAQTQTDRPKMRAPMFYPARPPMRRPQTQDLPQSPMPPQSEPPQSLIQPREVSFEDMAPPLPEQEIQQEEPQAPSQDDPNETPQQTVSRVCIRGGAKAQYSPPANTGLALGTENQDVPPLSDTGTLRVEVFTANRAIPIENAVIRVRNADNNQLVAVMTSDTSGDTSIFELPTPNRDLSLVPASVHPFVNYLVDIRADGYIPQSDLNVQMFGGVESILPANLIPLNT
ncbi:MAG: hypothetical protein UHH95_05480 [Oscillospiraceae bacterium]|nr:hypothetical protein [Oscillospiraceae bacterium]